MDDKFVLINKDVLVARIDELLLQNKNICESDSSCLYSLGIIAGKIMILEELLESIPLLPELEKAYNAGMKDKELSLYFDNPRARFMSNYRRDLKKRHFKIGDKVNAQGYCGVLILDSIDETLTNLTQKVHWNTISEDYLQGKQKTNNGEIYSEDELTYIEMDQKKNLYEE